MPKSKMLQSATKARRGTKYVPIADDLRERILNGSVTGKLANVPDLAKQFSTTQATMHKALTLLREEGLLHAITGRGTFVPPLRRPRSQSIGVIIYAPGGPLTEQMLAAIQKKSSSSRQRIAVEYSNGNPEDELIAGRQLVETHKVDGIISWASPNPRSLIDYLKQQRTPLVLVTENDNIPSNCSVVSNSRSGAASDLMTHLIAEGYKKIGFVTNRESQDADFSQHREAQYRRSLKAARLEAFDTCIINPLASNANAHDTAIRQLKEMEAVFCANDSIATGLAGICLNQGWRVPEDLAIVSFDNTYPARLLRFTSVDQHFEKAGEEAVKMLLDEIEGRRKAPARLDIPPELHIRSSSQRKE
ncbi:LacI family DNA-binding transcriptional regulator [Rubellicoccus peritrichatus]|uniref:LacI family DNA-binding transcriptional regulator n=1 Tax=Rubellicoccus peritrichatus TaxID=3080537 RepID=A0AAQ3LDL4_9BACT|nr:LacI family DNA-binding transcriptional regulator [Puniceicoccus sp. CR14]WOO43437.1 LacI family DNA-binding transcriptional regulator [Puniceicoccus sp. CR14]